MREDPSYNEEFSQIPEHTTIPEHSALPEYTPVFPDYTFFKESSVTTREENVFQGRAPEWEEGPSDRREERRKRNRFALLQKFLGSAVKGGAAVLCTAAVVATICSPADASRGTYAPQISEAVQSAMRPAFTQQTGYTADDLIDLWNGDPDAPHKYDTENPIIYTASSCTESGEFEYVCLECGVHVHGEIPASGHVAAEAIHENETEATCLLGGGYTEVINCSVCGEEISRREVRTAKADHIPGEAERLDEVLASCEEEGSYVELVTCTACGKELSRTTVAVPAAGHRASEAAEENRVEAGCTEDGHYDEAVYCSVCGAEISRTTVVIPAAGHTAAQAVMENRVEASCTEAGHYDEAVYCSVCGEEISRTTAVIPAAGHTAGQAVTENRTEASCTEDGHYEEVVYCSVCGEEISRSTVRIAAAGHSAGSAVIEDETDATCTEGGSYDRVVYCSVCGEEMSRRMVRSSASGHSAAAAVTENETEATCTEDGSYESVVYCSVCGEELSRETIISEATGHIRAEAVMENVSEATCEADGYGEEVVYCAVCGEELERTGVAQLALGHLTPDEPTKEWLYGHEDDEGNVTGPDCLDGGAYQEAYYCERCGELLSLGEEVSVEPPGHTYSGGLPSDGEVVVCSVCGLPVIDAFYGNNYVYYYLDTDYIDEVLSGYEYDSVMLWSYADNSYINEGGYEYGDSGSTSVPRENLVSGNKLRIDFVFINQSGNTVRISSSDVVIE